MQDDAEALASDGAGLATNSATSRKATGRRGGIMRKISASNFTSSTKIEALVQVRHISLLPFVQALNGSIFTSGLFSASRTRSKPPRSVRISVREAAFKYCLASAGTEHGVRARPTS